MKKIVSSLGGFGRSLSLGLIGLLTLVVVLGYKLFSITDNKYALSEVSTFLAAQSWHTIFENPLELPYKTLLWLLATMGHHSYGTTRLVSILFGAGAAVLFYYIVRNWMSNRVAVLSSLLFIVSNGFLHTARLGTAAVLQFGVLALFALPILVHKAPAGWRRRLVSLSAIIIAAALYIPGMIWQLALSAFMRRKKLLRVWKSIQPLQKTALLVASVVIVAPLIYSFAKTPDLLLTWIGLPNGLPSSTELFTNAQTLISTLFYHSGFSPEYVTHGGALLTTSELILIVLGIYAQLKFPRNNTNYYLLGAVIIAVALVLLSGAIFIPLLVPLLYLFVAGGIYFFLNEWLSVFPKNPIARVFGVSIVALIVAFAAGYHLRSYFDAWPNSKVTNQTYTNRQP